MVREYGQLSHNDTETLAIVLQQARYHSDIMNLAHKTSYC